MRVERRTETTTKRAQRRSAGLRMLAASALLVGVSVGCVPKPKQEYTNDQLKQVASLEELMRVQAQTMDPQFAKIGQGSFTDSEFAAAATAGQRIKASAEEIRDRMSNGRPPSFSAFAGELATRAGELITAANGKDATGISTALGAIRTTCRACHKEHR